MGRARGRDSSGAHAPAAPAWVGSAAMSAFWSFWLAWLQSSLHQAFLAEAFPFLRGILHMKAYKL